MLNPGLTDRVALVTGANNPRGIGAAVARALAAQGAAVFLTAYRVPPPEDVDAAQADQPGEAMYTLGNAQGAGPVVDLIRAEGGRAEAIEADLSDPAGLPAIFDAAEAAFGPVEVLVNNAAAWTPDTFIPSSDALVNTESVQWLGNDAVHPLTADTLGFNFDVNTRGAVLLLVEFARRHIARGADWGRVINLSTGGAYCFPSEVSYGASKAALEAYSRSAATELGQFGITVNIIAPGPIQTGWITDEMAAGITQQTPLRRVGQSEDIADVAVFLASEQARWVTGQLLHVGGGHTM